MLRRSKKDTVSDLVSAVAHDKKLRKQLLSVLGHSSAAAKQGRRHVGMVSRLVGLAEDDALVRELRQARGDLQRALSRVEKRRGSKTVRRLLLLVLGAIPLARSAEARSKVVGAAQQLATKVRPGSDTPPANLEDLTKEELYARAQEADIPGRSDMSKDDLIAALRARG